MRGIYAYIDTKNDNVVYIGKDSHIYKNRRHLDHFQKSNYNKQHINKVLQNNPNRYKYEVLLKGNLSEKLLNAFEMVFIRKYKPIFNFTIGGEGTKGFKFSEENKKILSNAHKNKNATLIKGGKRKGQQVYCIKKEGKVIKSSKHPYGLVNWFNKEYKGEYLQIIGDINITKYIDYELYNRYKNEYRLIKSGKPNGRQIFAIYKNKKMIKRSYYIHKLYKWFGKEFSNEYLYLDVK